MALNSYFLSAEDLQKSLFVMSSEYFEVNGMNFAWVSRANSH